MTKSKLLKIENLFPTKLGLYEINKEYGLELAVKLASSEWDALQFIDADLDLQTLITETMKDYSLDQFSVSIVEAWVRKLHSGANDLGLHCDSHYGGTHVIVFWLTGEDNRGGDLVLYDPAWRNPQRPNVDGTQPQLNTKTVPFKCGQVVIFPADVWHSVTEYSGTLRYGLNVVVSLIPKR